MGDAADDMYEAATPEEACWEDEYDAEERLDKVCTRCGAAGLHWDDPQGRAWVLAEPNGNRHVCPPTDDGFEVLM